MPNIENISVRTTTKCPNCVLIGGVTNNNGVLGGFSQNSYCEVPNGRHANATYVIKFTTPSTAPSGTQDIFLVQRQECFEQTSSAFNAFATSCK